MATLHRASSSSASAASTAAEDAQWRAGCSVPELTSSVRRADAHAFHEWPGYERTSVRVVKPLASGD